MDGIRFVLLCGFVLGFILLCGLALKQARHNTLMGLTAAMEFTVKILHIIALLCKMKHNL
jgi:hypothetical protein